MRYIRNIALIGISTLCVLQAHANKPQELYFADKIEKVAIKQTVENHIQGIFDYTHQEELVKKDIDAFNLQLIQAIKQDIPPTNAEPFYKGEEINSVVWDDTISFLHAKIDSLVTSKKPLVKLAVQRVKNKIEDILTADHFVGCLKDYIGKPLKKKISDSYKTTLIAANIIMKNKKINS